MLHEGGKALKAVGVGLFDTRDHLKGLADQVKPLFGRDLGKTRVIVLPLLELIVVGRPQVPQQIRIQVNGIIPVQ